MSICYFNGKFAPVSECAIPVTDMSIQRGVGAFESIRVYEGRPFAMMPHLERLAGSAAGAGIEAADIISKLPELIKEGLKREDTPKDGLAKPYITGGDVNNKGHFPQPRFFIIFDEVHKPTIEEQRDEQTEQTFSADKEHKLPFRPNTAFKIDIRKF